MLINVAWQTNAVASVQTATQIISSSFTKLLQE